jgi:hypothetical protein
MKGDNPAYKGFLTTDAKDPKQRKNIGKVALWTNSSQNAKAPMYQGMVQTDKGNYRIAVWKFEPKEEKEEGL